MKLDRFIKRPVLSTVISVLTVILGLLGLVSLPIEQYPDIAPPTVMVQTFYQGADAQTVQKSAGGANQRCGGYDLHDLYGHQRGYGFHHRLL